MIADEIAILDLLVLVFLLVGVTRQFEGDWQKSYTFVLLILVCYLVPSLMLTACLIDTSKSNLWPTAKDYFLPVALVLLTLSIDLKAIIGLGPKTLFMFVAAILTADLMRVVIG